MSAISMTKNGAPGPDGVDIEVFKGLNPEVKLELTMEYNNSWRMGEIPEIPDQTHSSIQCQSHTKTIDVSRAIVLSHARKKIVARRITSLIEPLLPSRLEG